MAWTDDKDERSSDIVPASRQGGVFGDKTAAELEKLRKQYGIKPKKKEK